LGLSKRSIDVQVYEEELLAWLPRQIIDCHVHVGLKEHCGAIAPERIAANWAIEVGADQTWQQLRSNLDMLFPEQEVHVLAFGVPFREVDLVQNNDYVLRGVLDPANRAAGLFVTRPEWDASLIELAMSRGFVGIKPYPDLAPHKNGEPSIFDFLPHAHLRVLDACGGILLLHLPRKRRLGDPDNIRELIEIHNMYSNIKIIVAHIGRAFCLPTAQKGLPHLVEYPRIFFDTAANLNADVFQYALEIIGPDRILYGSDLPITLMRGVREHLGENYINYTDAPYSWNVNRKSPNEEAKYTYYLYEEIKALIKAVQRAGLGMAEFEKIMRSNMATLFEDSAYKREHS
jgi:microsomal dipeptidase-like Zn-dependent dipeptidase